MLGKFVMMNRLVQIVLGIKKIEIIFGDDYKAGVDIAGDVDDSRGIAGNRGTVIIVIN